MSFFGSRAFWAWLVLSLLLSVAWAPESVGKTAARIVAGFNTQLNGDSDG